jgi:hypothetical protein
MSQLVSVEANGNLIRIAVNGDMSLEAYQHIVPFINDAIEQFGTARLIFDVLDFQGPKPGAAWDDLELDLDHWRHIERVAFVCDERDEGKVAKFCRPFTGAALKCFRAHELEAAEEWIHEDLAPRSSAEI